jgi:hypothetical protein
LNWAFWARGRTEAARKYVNLRDPRRDLARRCDNVPENKAAHVAQNFD